MKKHISILSAILVVALASGCVISSEKKFNPIGLLPFFFKSKVIAPVIAPTTLALMQQEESVPFYTTAAYALTTLSGYDISCSDVANENERRSQEAQVLTRLASPIFSGFTYASYSDGDTFTSTVFDKTITTTVSIVDDVITYTGDFGDGGGSYTLVINTTDNTFTFDQRLIFNVHYNITASGPVAYQYASVAHATGSLTGANCDGTGYSNVLVSTINVGTKDIISTDSGFVYQYVVKSRNERSFFGVRLNPAKNSDCGFYGKLVLDGGEDILGLRIYDTGNPTPPKFYEVPLYGLYTCSYMWARISELYNIDSVGTITYLDRTNYAWNVEPRDFMMYTTDKSTWTYMCNDPAYYQKPVPDPVETAAELAAMDAIWGTD